MHAYTATVNIGKETIVINARSMLQLSKELHISRRAIYAILDNCPKSRTARYVTITKVDSQ